MDSLPIDICERIQRFVTDDKHLLTRQLYRLVCRQLRSMDHPTAYRLHQASLLWEAIRRIGCYDEIIVRGARLHHDIWYQELQDPYGLHCDTARTFRMFQERLEPTMHDIVFGTRA